MLKSVAFLVIMLWAAGSVEASQKTRIAIQFQGSRYNELSHQYSPSLTTAVLVEKKHKTYLQIEVELFGWIDPSHTVPERAYMRFLQTDAPSYVALIDKYLSWAQIAFERRDQFTKTIGSHKDAKGKLKFWFHSGDQTHHYLAISFCGFGTCLDQSAAYFDTTNAEKLKALLQALGQGKIKAENLDNIYK